MHIFPVSCTICPDEAPFMRLLWAVTRDGPWAGHVVGGPYGLEATK